MDMQSDLTDTDDYIDLVQLLVLEAGRILEDAAPEFTMSLPKDHLNRELAINRLESAVH